MAPVKRKEWEDPTLSLINDQPTSKITKSVTPLSYHSQQDENNLLSPPTFRSVSGKFLSLWRGRIYQGCAISLPFLAAISGIDSLG